MANIWQSLDHNTIINEIEKSSGIKLTNLLLKRNSYINRVYEMEESGSKERLIVKFYRPGRWPKEMLLEEHDFLMELKESEVPVIPPLKINQQTLFEFSLDPSINEVIYYALFPKKGGRALDEFNKQSWEEVGRLVARIHLKGALRKNSQRIVWKPSVVTKKHIEALHKTDFLLPDFKQSFDRAADNFMQKAEPLFSGFEYILLHGDCHKGNLIHRLNEGIFVVDFDDICVGPPIQDAWMLFPDKIEKCEKEWQWFLKGYETFRAFDLSSLSLYPALRGMRLVHFAAWQAVQCKDADFSLHFPEAGNSRYWNELIKDLQETVYS
jgi:Ser/Thr protein kinase RdoA (MazF antagonist)